MEGFLSSPTVNKFLEVDSKISTKAIHDHLSVGRHNLNVIKKGRTFLYVSSWHLNEHESAALWELYSNNNEVRRCLHPQA